MSIKELLGEELYIQVTAALKGKGASGKDVELGVVNDGTFVPADRLTAQIDKTKAAEKLAADTKAQLDNLSKAGDPAELQKALEDAKADANALKEQHAKDLAVRDVKYAANLMMQDAQDVDLAFSLIDASTCSITEAGKVEGLEAQIKELRKNKAFLFKTAPEPAKDPKPAKEAEGAPAQPSAAGDPGTQTKFKGAVPADGTGGAGADPFVQAFLKG